VRAPEAPLLRGIDLVELLWMHQGSMATRSFSEGNQEYLALMIDASRRLVRALAEAPRSPLLPRSRVAALVDLVEGQVPRNAAATAQQIVPILANLRDRDRRAQTSALYLRGPLPPLPSDYSRVVVYFGSAMGLGDQINFYQLLEALVRHCRRAKFLVYTLYPGLWTRLLPGVKEESFRDDPLSPFFDLNRPPPDEGRELVITADFEVFNLHLHTVVQRPQRDILEISLGRMAAWLNGGSSPWIRMESFSAQSENNNYVFMHAMAGRLAPKVERAVWEPVREPKRTPKKVNPDKTKPDKPRTILLNPFTSKKLPFTAELWAEGQREVSARLRGRIPFDVLVYPGVERSTYDFAEEIRDRLSQSDHPITARLLTAAGEPLTPHNALPALLDELDSIDLCVTADTFTSHLVPMYRIPTVVVAYSHFRKFWVPSRWSFNCPVERMKDHGLSLVARILALQESTSPRALARRQKAAALLRATEEAARCVPSVRTLARLETALADVFRGLDSAFPAYEETQRWLLLWTRLTGAHHREPGTEEGLLGYLRLWQESEAFRLLTVGV
jgi:hypothetical protein